MSDRQIFAVIGLGSIGQRHAGNLRTLGHAVIGFDPDGARRSAAAEAGMDVTGSRNEALDGAAGAIVCSPSAHHLDDLEAAIEAGCPVMVEKPLGHDLDRARGLVSRAEAAGLTIAVGYNLRFHPCVERARAILAEGLLGSPLWLRALAASYLPDWRPGHDYRKGYAADPVAGGVIMDYAHELDLAIHLLGPAALTGVEAGRSGHLDLPTEDVADMVLTHSDDVRSAIHVDFLTRPAQRVTEIAGTGGFLRIDLMARRCMRWKTDGTVAEDESFAGGFADDYVLEMEDFLASLPDGTPRCTGGEGLMSLEIALAARAAAQGAAA